MPPNPMQDSADKIFDVSKPGQTAPSSSSRPLVIGHKPLLKDPMVNQINVSEMNEYSNANTSQLTAEDLPSGSPVPAPSHRPPVDNDSMIANQPNANISLNPPNNSNSDTPDNSSEAGAPIAADHNGVSADVGENNDSTEEIEDAITHQETINDSEVIENQSDVISSDSTPLQTHSHLAKEEHPHTAHTELVKKLVESKQYYAPIGESARKKRSVRHIVAGSLLILFLCVALAYLMADVGIIKTNYNLPVHFFKQTSQ